MIEWVRKFLYRIFCVIALLVSVYLVVDFLYSGTFDYRVFVMFVLMVVVTRISLPSGRSLWISLWLILAL